MDNNQMSTVKNNLTLILVIIAALVFSVSVIVTKKSFDNFSEYRDMTSQEKKVLSTLKQNKENIEGLQEEAEELEESQGIRLDYALSALPMRYHPAADLAAFELLVESSGVQLQDLQIQPAGDGLGGGEGAAAAEPEAGLEEGGGEGGGDLGLDEGGPEGPGSSGVATYSATVSVTGSYSSIKSFLQNIEESHKPLISEQLQLASDGDDSDITVELRIVLHHQESGSGEDSLEGGAEEGMMEEGL